MLQVYFAENDKEWSKDKLDEMMLPLPHDMLNKILAYKGWKERQSRILGKWMLMRLLETFEPGLTLGGLKYTEFNKPHFSPAHATGGTTNFDFSIAHSGDIVICAGIMNAQIGVDIEKILPIELTDYEDHLTDNEWKHIQHAPDIQKAFYEIWTKKEAIMKALGRGIDMELDKLDVCGDTVKYEDSTYWFSPLAMAHNYLAHIASNRPLNNESINAERYH